MSISVIIPYTKGEKLRQRALHRLFWCIEDQTYKDFELLLCEVVFGDEKNTYPYFVDKHIILKDRTPFNKSWCVNVAVKQASHKDMIIIDADMQFGGDYFQKISDFIKDRKFFVAYDTVRLLKGRDNINERLGKASDIKAAAHVWYCNKDFYWEIGGMNEKYEGYGAEDTDMWRRAAHVLGGVDCMEYQLVHSYHHWHPKDSNFPLNNRRVELFDETMRDVGAEIRRLKTLNLGGATPWVPNAEKKI